MGALTRSLRALIVLVAAGAVAVLLVVMKAEPEKEERKAAAPLVEVKPLTPQSKVMAVQAFGTVKPRKAVNVTAEAGGRITYVNPAFVAGGFVAEGEIVAGVDKRSYRLDRAASRVRIRQGPGRYRAARTGNCQLPVGKGPCPEEPRAFRKRGHAAQKSVRRVVCVSGEPGQGGNGQRPGGDDPPENREQSGTDRYAHETEKGGA